jgi:hypothetical protein
VLGRKVSLPREPTLEQRLVFDQQVVITAAWTVALMKRPGSTSYSARMFRMPRMNSIRAFMVSSLPVSR